MWRFLIDVMLGEIEHILRNFYILNVVEILVLRSDLIGVAEQGIHKSVSGSNPMMCSRLVSTSRPIATMSILRMVSRMTAKASWPTLPSEGRIG